MKRSRVFLTSLFAASCGLLTMPAVLTADVTTRFLFQGQLQQDGNPANGGYDLQFRLLDSQGTPIGAAISMPEVPVQKGLFSVMLDFGREPFSPPGAAALAVSVRPVGGPAYTPLNPPQRLGAAPYAVTAGGLAAPLTAAQLPGGVAVLDTPQEFTGPKAFSNSGNRFVGDGAGIVNLAADQLRGSLQYDRERYVAAGGTGTGGQCHGLAIVGNTLLVANGSAGLATADLSNPDSLRLTPVATAVGYALDVRVDGSTAYVSGREGGLSAFDVSVPSAPRHLYTIGSGGTMGVTDAAVAGPRVYVANFERGLGTYRSVPVGAPPALVGFNTNALGAMAIRVVGTRAYLACSANGFRIFDLANPNAPQLLGSATTPVFAFGPSDAQGLAIEGGLAYVADKGSGLNVFNISNPATPVRVAIDKQAFGAQDAWIDNGRLYLACGGRGLRIYDIRSSTPSLIQTMDDPGEALAAVARDNQVYLANGPDGLRAYRTGTWLFSDLLTVDSRMQVNGDLSVRTLTIQGGADIAEPFQIVGPALAPGSVVVIDPDNPGKVRESHDAYDGRVAGVVSGAGGVNPGLSLQQHGVIEGQQGIALTGRVYVQASTENGRIRAGDLLTTSGTPGHAMRATEPSRSHGAVIGKALGSLDDPTGLVLVLVNLQ